MTINCTILSCDIYQSQFQSQFEFTASKGGDEMKWARTLLCIVFLLRSSQCLLKSKSKLVLCYNLNFYVSIHCNHFHVHVFSGYNRSILWTKKRIESNREGRQSGTIYLYQTKSDWISSDWISSESRRVNIQHLSAFWVLQGRKQKKRRKIGKQENFVLHLIKSSQM